MREGAGPEVIDLPAGIPPVRVLPRDADVSAAFSSTTHEQVWSEMLDANGQLHDGPIWAVRSIGPDALVVQADQYKRLAVQADPRIGDLGVRLLGVKGLLVGRDASGTERILLARRGGQTRIYQGLWETAPAGGIDVRQLLGHQAVRETLLTELHEELGLTMPPGVQERIVAALRDPIARSVDLIARIDWPDAVNPHATLCHTGTHAWEYIDSAWTSPQDVAAMLANNPATLSPPTLAVLRWLGWVGG
ncbi:MAG: NUDIX domain-containing protein [bacterium]